MPQFIRLAEASDKTSKPLLVAELLEGLKEVAGDTKVTKVMIEGAIKSLPVTKVKAKEETPNGAKWLIPQAVKVRLHLSSACERDADESASAFAGPLRFGAGAHGRRLRMGIGCVF